MAGDFADESSLCVVLVGVMTQGMEFVGLCLFVKVGAVEVSPSRTRDQLAHKLTVVGNPRNW